jgi:hypothetical protein
VTLYTAVRADASRTGVEASKRPTAVRVIRMKLAL